MFLKAVGILGTLLGGAAESSAFIVLPPWSSGTSCTQQTRVTLVGKDSQQVAPSPRPRLGAGAALGGGVDEDSAEEDGDPAVPRLVVMDLDDTLWGAEIEQMKGSPFAREKGGKVTDCGGKVIDLFPGVREALLEVHRGGRFAGTRLAIASRTPKIRWAREVLGLVELEPGLPMDNVFSHSEIYPGSKIGHFGELQRNTGVAFTDMIVFDDWDKNCKEVGSLGVTCVECRRGVNRDVWSRALARYAAAKNSSSL